MRVLVVDDEPSMREMLGVLLRRAGYEAEFARGVFEAKTMLAEGETFDLVVTDLMMPDGSGIDVLTAARGRDEATQVLVVTAYSTTEAALDAMKRGAYAYLQKPFKNTELLATLDKAAEKRRIVDENRSLRRVVKGDISLSGIVGKSPPMQRVFELVRRAASSRANVLITGESGTGKEMVARALHALGDRSDAPFVAINCGALPETLMESELFGYEKGAFTGAVGRKDGLFRVASGGSLFLDEIGELSLALQVKLLRVLQEKSVRPLGGEREIEVDARVIAATNREVDEEVKDGRFRQDLYYRLNVVRIDLPPLRERREDIPLLAEHLLEKHGALARKKLAFSAEAMHWLVDYDFPGNVRELENLVERAVALAAGADIRIDDLREPVVAPAQTPSIALPAEGIDLDSFLAGVEKTLLEQALERAGGNRTQAAKLVGMTFRSFRYRLAKFGFGDDE